MHVHSMRLSQLDRFGWPAHARRAAFSRTGQPNNLAIRWRVFADHVVLSVGDDHAPVLIHAQVLGPVKLRLERWSAIAARAFLSRAHDRPNPPGPIDDAERMPRAFEHIHVSFAVRDDCP